MDICRVDVNSDDFITTDELQAWILRKVEEHFTEAADENEKIFNALDTDNDGNLFSLLCCVQCIGTIDTALPITSILLQVFNAF